MFGKIFEKFQKLRKSPKGIERTNENITKYQGRFFVFFTLCVPNISYRSKDSGCFPR